MGESAARGIGQGWPALTMFRICSDMGKRTPIRPSFTRSVAAMRDHGSTVAASCSKCRAWTPVDLAPIIAAKGEAFDLWGRRARCRHTPGCTGEVRFYFDGRGRFELMAD